jgi:hypothetical protein
VANGALARIHGGGGLTANIEIDISVDAGVAKLWVDGTRVRVDVNGRAAVLVAPGSHHALSWAVRGAPGTAYTVKITAPPEAKLTRGDTFDGDAFDAGIAWFTVRETT